MKSCEAWDAHWVANRLDRLECIRQIQADVLEVFKAHWVANTKLLKEIRAEQEHGRQKYGRGKDDIEHDNRQPESVWHDCIQDHNNRAREATPLDRRQHLIKIAGLAVSAIEAFDRNYSKGKANDPQA